MIKKEIIGLSPSSKYEIKIYNIRQLSALKPEIWKHQRTLNNDRVEQLTKLFIENIKKRGELCIRNPLYMCQIKDKLLIIDGQHRYGALVNIINLNYYTDLYVYVMIINCQTEDDIRFEFNNINNTTPMPECFINTDQYIDLAIGVLKKKYRNFKETINRVNRPNINVDDIKSCLITEKIVKTFDLNVESLVNVIINLDSKYRILSKEELARKLYVRPSDATYNNIYGKIHTDIGMCYLGLFKTEHSYIWIQDIKDMLTNTTPLITF